MPVWTKEQQQAIELDNTNIIVSAGAGSGKTAVLSERVIRKLKSNVNINELLILTFTKAAADEMKERIRKKISKEEDLKDQLSLIDSAYITTFDAFALSIVKKYNYLLNVSKNIQIADNNIFIIKKESFIDEVFEELYSEKNEMFLNFIKDFCSKDDKSIKLAILEINNKLDMIYEKEGFLDNYFENFYNDTFIENKIKEYEDLLLSKIENINLNILSLNEYTDSSYEEKINQSIGELLISNNYKSIKENLNLLPRLTKDCLEEAKLYKDNVNNEIKNLQMLCNYEDINEIKEDILATKKYVSVIIEILKRLDRKIHNYKEKYDLYEFNDIACMAIKVLEENEKERQDLKAQLNEIMIDEYQDTNDLQDKFISLIANNNVYMVGDVKQSIYRFRNANPNLFKNKYNNFSKHNGGVKIDLNKNFRSRKEVLSNINLIFNPIMDDILGGADYKKSHQMIFGNLSYDEKGKTSDSHDLEILSYFSKETEFKKEEIEIFTIAKDIKNKIKNEYLVFDKDEQLKRPLKYEDIVILMDRSTNFNLYKKIFEYLNIPLSIYKDEVISESEDIIIIKNILGLMFLKKDSVEYKYCLMSIGKSYLFSYEEEDIINYFVNKNYDDCPIIKTINELNYYKYNLKDLIIKIIECFDIYSKLVLVGNVNIHFAIFDYLINLAESLNDIGYTVEDFYEYLNKLQEKKLDVSISIPQSEKGVKIMTIHKSKGLEYHLCYYSGLYSKFNLSEMKEKFLFSQDYGFIVPCINNGIKDTIYKTLLKNKYNNDEISEKIRLFYVALTRAKEKMILIAPLEDDLVKIDTISDEMRFKYNSFLDIIKSIKYLLLKYIKKIEVEDLGLTRDYKIVKKSNYKNEIVSDGFKLTVNEKSFDANVQEKKHFSKTNHKLIDMQTLNNIEFGRYVHAVLENINFSKPNYDSLSEIIKTKIQTFLRNDILIDAMHLYKEYEFSYSEENVIYHGIIDLLIEKENQFIIVDYKLQNINDKAYKMQLAGYKEYIEHLTNKKVDVYLYSIMEEQLIKVDV